MGQTRTPQLGLHSFSCPHCKAFAHQDWYQTLIRGFTDKGSPRAVFEEDALEMEHSTHLPPDIAQKMSKFFRQIITGKPFVDESSESQYASYMNNCFATLCYSCGDFALWIHERIVWPTFSSSHFANDDMPTDIKRDFEEAAAIVDSSPRGAAALLRLCIQKICKHCGEAGENINTDIGRLVQKGLNERVQKALDIVRVIGNEAVHPGQIDLKDNEGVAGQLFTLVNLIVEELISKPKKIDAIYALIPETKVQAIKDRDIKKS